ncbi:MAG: hypothetical protein A4E52_02149 [Pelotomaculum sp. PtaB.Bin013]|uniref:Uncharacterized protein n=1 Tax=Pelotomaculum isophthalicicum JI TaxID=947010 RepID=A0A9X4JVP3_9FIRM|nr:hypothetical protein [Pelotomaculum isophthalicicum]MDF9407768.1 hypothetical protein [Pelotomaculum isophthalicicum JI]OPX81813.1 MAG: hypothetical protein A4E52_02149 [Pelotomaculum sp. PtaB.Bin013]
MPPNAPVAPVKSINGISACELIYKRHDLFSLNTDRGTNAPLTSLLSCVGDMQEGDSALAQVLCEPVSRLQWEYDSGKAYEKFQKGRMPGRIRGGWEFAGRSVCQVLRGGFQLVFDSLDDFIGSGKMSRNPGATNSFEDSLPLSLPLTVKNCCKTYR